VRVRRFHLLVCAGLVGLAAGCSAGKGNFGHVKVESTAFAAQTGLTVKDWGWSGGMFSVQLSTSADFSGKWILYAQSFNARGEPLGGEVQFLNFNMQPGSTAWYEIPDLKLTEPTARVAFDLQSALVWRREPHY
jgi:hypothetical protein